MLENSQDLIGARRGFLHSLPLNLEQRTRAILVLLHSNSARSMAPYNGETSTVRSFVEHVFGLIIQGREDLADKSQDARVNIPRLFFAMSKSPIA